jgi:hypothetical protein
VTTNCRIPDCGAITDAVLCRSCGTELRRTIEELPGLMHDLSVLATGQARVYRANGKPVPLEDLVAWDAERTALPARLRAPVDTMTLVATRTMVNLAARDKLDETWNALTTWARLLIDSGADGTLPTPVTPLSLAGWLADRINAVRYDEAGEQMFTEITKLRGQVVHLVDRAPSRVYAGPCHAPLAEGQRCERALYAAFNPWSKRDEREPDDRVIVCDGFRPANLRDDDAVPIGYGCGAEHTISDRTAWLIAELYDALYPLDFWLEYLPKLLADDLPHEVPRSVVTAWVRQLRLIPKSVNRDADELFRGGDVMDLMRAYRPKRYAPRPNRRVS